MVGSLENYPHPHQLPVPCGHDTHHTRGARTLLFVLSSMVIINDLSLAQINAGLRLSVFHEDFRWTYTTFTSFLPKVGGLLRSPIKLVVVVMR